MAQVTNNKINEQQLLNAQQAEALQQELIARQEEIKQLQALDLDEADRLIGSIFLEKGDVASALKMEDRILRRQEKGESEEERRSKQAIDIMDKYGRDARDGYLSREYSLSDIAKMDRLPERGTSISYGGVVDWEENPDGTKRIIRDTRKQKSAKERGRYVQGGRDFVDPNTGHKTKSYYTGEMEHLETVLGYVEVDNDGGESLYGLDDSPKSKKGTPATGEERKVSGTRKTYSAEKEAAIEALAQQKLEALMRGKK
jgi:hypothetical protein